MGGQDLSAPSDAGADGGMGAQDLSALLVAISGHVSGLGANTTPQPIAGATVQILGASPANETTTAADGSYTLMVPAGATLFVGASASTYVSGSSGVVVPITGGNAEFQLIPSTLFNNVAGRLSPPLSADPTKGDVVIAFNNTNNAGGYGAIINANHGMTFTLLAGTNPMYSSTTVPGGDSTLVFPNTDAGSTPIALVAPPGKSCTMRQAITSWRVDPGYVLIVQADCM
jgi:hypothetical protein